MTGWQEALNWWLEGMHFLFMLPNAVSCDPFTLWTDSLTNPPETSQSSRKYPWLIDTSDLSLPAIGWEETKRSSLRWLADLFVIAFTRLAGSGIGRGSLAGEAGGRQGAAAQRAWPLGCEMVLINNKTVVITSCFGGHMTLRHTRYANNDFMEFHWIMYYLVQPPVANSTC